MELQVKYIFVTGGVTSSLGKGIVSASLGKLLQDRGHKVTIQKFDPYINVDPGTLNPYEHGECYVTQDGAETDLDLGHYERFLNITTSQENNVTTGRVYQTVIEKERRGEYNGKTVQVIPHITDEIKKRIRHLGESGKFEIIITEIGGTVGDIESLPYIEAVRQLKYQMGPGGAIVIHLTLLPFLRATGELKTKPTQHSVKALQESGVQPDILVCRTETPIERDIKSKIALFCNVETESVIECIDVRTIYDVPLKLRRENLDRVVLQKLRLKTVKPSGLKGWKNFLSRLKNPVGEVRIGLVGKYVELRDAYKSIAESIVHAGAENELKVNLVWIHSEKISTENQDETLGNLDGILIAPGFGERGVEGKIVAAKYAREKQVPFFGICLGMQTAVVEFARNVLKFKDCHSTEFNKKTKHPVICLMEEQKKVRQLGGTMRLGSYPCVLEKNSLVAKIYRKAKISERHRHRYEFNNKYLKDFEKAGLKPVGINPESGLVEIVELAGHPFFVGTQFHPEYQSRVESPHPLFVAFLKAAARKIKPA